jgi:hypothetical protein
MSLHEGNIARYRLRPAEYQAWRQGWRWDAVLTLFAAGSLVEPGGIEPPTSCMPCKRSPS